MNAVSAPPTCARSTTFASCRSRTRNDLIATYPFGLFASPMPDIVRLHASSGTTGRPIVVAYTREDLEVWSSVKLRSFAACGLHRRCHPECLRLRPVQPAASAPTTEPKPSAPPVVPISGGNSDPPDHGHEGLRRNRTSAARPLLPCTCRTGRRTGRGCPQVTLRVGVFGAEPWTDGMRRRIQAESNIGPTTSTAFRNHRPGLRHRMRPAKTACTSLKTTSARSHRPWPCDRPARTVKRANSS